MIKHTPIKFSDTALMIALKSSGGNFVLPTGLEYRRAYFKRSATNGTIVEITIGEYQKLVQHIKTELFKGLVINDEVKIIRKFDRTSDGKPTGKLHYAPHILTYGQTAINGRVKNHELLIPISFDTVESRFFKCLSDTTKNTTIENITVAESMIIQTLLKNIGNIYELSPVYTDLELHIKNEAALFYMNLQEKIIAREDTESITAIIKANLPKTGETLYKGLYKEFRKVCDGAGETKLLLLIHVETKLSLLDSLPETDNKNVLVKRTVQRVELENLRKNILN